MARHERLVPLLAAAGACNGGMLFANVLDGSGIPASGRPAKQHRVLQHSRLFVAMLRCSSVYKRMERRLGRRQANDAAFLQEWRTG